MGASRSTSSSIARPGHRPASVAGAAWLTAVRRPPGPSRCCSFSAVDAASCRARFSRYALARDLDRGSGAQDPAWGDPLYDLYGSPTAKVNDRSLYSCHYRPMSRAKVTREHAE